MGQRGVRNAGAGASGGDIWGQKKTLGAILGMGFALVLSIGIPAMADPAADYAEHCAECHEPGRQKPARQAAERTRASRGIAGAPADERGA